MAGAVTLSGLVATRAELAGEIVAAEARIADLEHFLA
jgi:hypothetical protein